MTLGQLVGRLAQAAAVAAARRGSTATTRAGHRSERAAAVGPRTRRQPPRELRRRSRRNRTALRRRSTPRVRRSPPAPLPHRRGRFGRHRPPRRRRAPRRRRPAEPLPGRSRRAPPLRRRSHALRAARCGCQKTGVATRRRAAAATSMHRPGAGATQRSLIEIDHIVPHALGGGADPRNLRLLCGAPITATVTRRAGHRASLHHDRCLPQGRATVGLIHTKPGRPIDVAGRVRFAAGNRLPTRAVSAPPSRRKWSGSWMKLVCTLAEPASRSANGCGPCWDGCEKSRRLIDHVVRPTGYRGGYHRQILAGCLIGRDGHDSDCSQPRRPVMEVGVPRGDRIAVVHGRLVVLLLAGVEGCDAQLALHEPVGIHLSEEERAGS